MATKARDGWLLLIVAGITLVWLVGFSWPGSRFTVKAQQTTGLYDARAIGIAMQAFAEDHGGMLPVSLSELVPRYIPESRHIRSIIITQPDKDSRLRAEWLYFGSGFTLANPPALLLASPQVINSQNRQTRVFLAGDRSARIELEAEYQSALAKTVQQIRERFAQATPPSRQGRHAWNRNPPTEGSSCS